MVETQPFTDVPVSVYTVVCGGEACMVVPEVAERPVAGDQVYVLAPLAVIGMESPKQITGLAGDILKTGLG